VWLLSTQISFARNDSHRHLTIVFHNYNEDIYVVEGMPEHRFFGIPGGRLVMSGPFEDQNSQEVATPGIILENGAYGARAIPLVEGQEVCDKWVCLKNKMIEMDSMRIGYRLFGPNSNTAVYFAIRGCGLPTSGPQYDVVPQIVGWGIDLYSLAKPLGPIPTPSIPSPPSPTGTPVPHN
jgi:hypothetical protein